MISKYDIIRAVEAEFNRIDIPEKKFNSDHEAWAVLLEEVEKLNSEFNPIKYGIDCLKQKVFLYWNAPSKLKDLDYIYEHAVLAAAEAVQVAAVAKKFIKKKEQVKNG